MAITFHDVERLQTLYPNHKIELKEGKLIIMSPSDSVSGEIGVQFSTLLNLWVREHRLGRVFDASTGFRLPNGDLLSPDVSFVSKERLKHNPRTYPTVVPELVVEIKSSHDRVHTLEEKIALFLSQGVKVGLLIDPDTQTVSIYRPQRSSAITEGEVAFPQSTTIRNGETLSIPELFPGWEVLVVSLWPPVYE
jgi:Uma2 family endonuclease